MKVFSLHYLNFSLNIETDRFWEIISMLGSFHLYPTASLLTELVQIFQGKYIVKASLQIEGVTRVTGMAAAEVLEDAEDRARDRVISLFGEIPNTQPQVAIVPAAKPDAAAVTSAVTSRATKQISAKVVDQGESPSKANVANSTIDVKREIIAEPIAVESPKPEVAAAITAIETKTPVAEPIAVESPKPEVAAAITAIETKTPVAEPIAVESPKPEVAAVAITDTQISTASQSQIEEVAVPATIATNTTKTRNTILSETTPQSAVTFDSTPEVSIAPPINQIPAVPIKPEPIPEPLFDPPPLDNFMAPETQTELPLAAVAQPSNVTPFVPRSYNPPTEIGIPDAPAATTTTKRTKKTTQPKDNSDDIAKIAVEMERLRWTIEQGRDYLFQTYRKKSRHSLSEEELRDFRSYLESQPTPIDDTLAIDPIAGF
jgi:hypothetical protein